MAAASEYATDVTVNEAEYRGLRLSFDLLAKQINGRVIICGDFNLVIRQMWGEIVCKAFGLRLLRHKAMEKLRSWSIHELLHIKRDLNHSADQIANAALKQEKGTVIPLDQELKIWRC